MKTSVFTKTGLLHEYLIVELYKEPEKTANLKKSLFRFYTCGSVEQKNIHKCFKTRQDKTTLLLHFTHITVDRPGTAGSKS